MTVVSQIMNNDIFFYSVFHNSRIQVHPIKLPESSLCTEKWKYCFLLSKINKEVAGCIMDLSFCSFENG